ncbi:hypothetical protein ACLKA7_001185 [Drosophila subpalustris]
MAEASTPKRTDDMESDEDSQHEDKTVIEEDVNTKMLRLIMEQMAVLTNKTVDLASQSERVANITQDLAIRVGNLEQPTIMGAHGTYGGAIGLTTQGGAGIVPKGRFAHGNATTDTDGGAIGLATQGGNGDALDKHVATKRVVSHGAQGAYGFVTQDGSGADTQGSNSHEIAISQGAQGAVGSATQGGIGARQDGQHGLDSSAYSLGRDGRLPGRGVSGARGVVNVSQIMDRLKFRFGRPELLIKSQMEMVNELSNVYENNLEKIVPFATKVENLVVYLRSAGATQYLQNPSLIEQLIGKLPIMKRMQWNEYASTILPFPDLAHFSGWLNEISRSVARATMGSSKPQGKAEQRSRQKTVMQTTKDSGTKNDNKMVCYICKGDHQLGKCDLYLKATVAEKWAMAKELGVCYGCLHRGHSMTSCKFTRACNLNGYEGSSASLINEKLADQIGVNVDKTKLTLNWIGKHATDVMSMECQFKIRAQENKKWMRINGNTVPELQLPLQSVDVNGLKEKFGKLRNIPIKGYRNADPMLLIGKTKCAPLKMLSMPRLELQAAVLGTRLKNLILASHIVNVDSVTLWSDSRTVIAWIRSDHRQYKQFVAHRISEILETTGENDWRWIPSHLNAADKATKAPRNMKYTPGNIWTKGPEFLLTDERNWPSTALESNLDDSLERKKVVFTIQQELLFDMDRFSNYLRLKRTFGWILRFIKRLRHQNVPDAYLSCKHLIIFCTFVVFREC